MAHNVSVSRILDHVEDVVSLLADHDWAFRGFVSSVHRTLLRLLLKPRLTGRPVDEVGEEGLLSLARVLGRMLTAATVEDALTRAFDQLAAAPVARPAALDAREAIAAFRAAKRTSVFGDLAARGAANNRRRAEEDAASARAARPEVEAWIRGQLASCPPLDNGSVPLRLAQVLASSVFDALSYQAENAMGTLMRARRPSLQASAAVELDRLTEAGDLAERFCQELEGEEEELAYVARIDHGECAEDAEAAQADAEAADIRKRS